MAGPVAVGLHPSLAPSAPEVKYALRTLLRIAGVSHVFVWAGTDGVAGDVDLYYGPRESACAARVRIDAAPIAFRSALALEPRRTLVREGLPLLDFDGMRADLSRHPDGTMRIQNDIVFTSFWLLTGAREPSYTVNRWGDVSLEGTALLAEQLLTQPLVSRYGALLREHFAALGHPVLRPGWLGGWPGAAFAFTHDVDYPQMIRWIEVLRLLVSRGPRRLGSVAGVLRGTNHFWRFADWIDAERTLGTRPAFYFLARQGSLLQYAMGTPDGFYDVRSAEFRELFRVLRAEGCEIGLHASFHAHRSVEQLRSEKTRLEEAAGVPVEGNRHHYWHLDPQAPNETLRKHAAAGFGYDASLGFEYYPGFRRGTCHPFRVFDPTERRELDLVELPTAWMDNHFDGRLARNGIADPEACAAGLVEAARATGGVVVVDYHVRGMNRDFYPRWGAWLMEFVRRRLDSCVAFRTPGEIVALYRRHEAAVDARSGDETSHVDGEA